MRGATRKFFLDRYSHLDGDEDYIVDAEIYSSGGILHTVYIEAMNEAGKVIYRERRNFRTSDARNRAYEFAKTAVAGRVHNILEGKR